MESKTDGVTQQQGVILGQDETTTQQGDDKRVYHRDSQGSQ